MYSQCPECLTRFRVTAAALRVARGTVRCGRCGSAFDALPRLSDNLQDAGARQGPSPPAEMNLPGTEGIAGGAGAGLLATGERVGGSDFHFSADDIENVFIDAHDWQSRFGASSSPGDRAGKKGDTSSVELQNLVDDGDIDDAAADPANPTVWVHEPESVEDITLEGERIQIEGMAGFEEDFLEREIEKEIEELQRAELTGSQRALAEDAGWVGDGELTGNPFSDDAVAIDGIEPLHDIDSTDNFEILRHVPDSAYPDDEAPNADAGLQPTAKPVSALPAAVATAAAGLARDTTTPASSARRAVPVAEVAPARWRRFPDTDSRTDEHDQQLADELAAAADERRSRWAWGLGALLLAFVLSSQLAHHYRLQLARDASIGPTLREIYSRLGRPLPPNWNLAAFELRQWGAQDSAPAAAGDMTVRASIRNGASIAQPMPLLRLELEDRFGGTVARRDFEPAEYLKDPAQAGRLLAAGASTEAELAVVGATPEAVGYRLDVCLREESRSVRCAQGPGETTQTGQAPQ